MSRLCFGTYAKVLQISYQEPNDNQAIAYLLFGLILDNADVRNKNGDPFDLNMPRISDLFNFKRNVPSNIVAASALPRVIQAAYVYFSEKVVAFLNPHNKDELMPHMVELINEDSSITQNKKDALLAKATSGSLNEFLADTFLYSIQRPNKIPAGEADSEISKELTPMLDNIARLQDVLASLPSRPASLAVPEDVEPDEMTYVTELLAAYADAEKISELPKESLDQYPRYQNDFGRRRKDYYAAETIRRASRDVFGDRDPDQFGILKDETYDGVIDVHAQDYPHGVARLNAVMSQAAAVNVDKCILSRMPDWIGASEKKGVCHILVNDKRIKGWVSNE